LPTHCQPTVELDDLLGRPPGWLADHAGIGSRRVWADEDALAAAVNAARACLERAGARREDIGALLVTSEAPPLLAGLAAALHANLGLGAHTVALEVGGACTGFLAALWTARRLLPEVGTVLLLAVEAPSRYLRVRPGPAGEAAALFGDAAAACLLGGAPMATPAFPLVDVVLGTDGHAGNLLRVCRAEGGVELDMDGPGLAMRAVRALADALGQVVERHGLALADLEAIVVHGGNGRLPAVLARQLDVPVERVWSETARTGNLGPASLPVAWSAQTAHIGPFAWAAVGAGLMWGAALFGQRQR
jgi:3-oxoacyl-[acyl-carrier-protein] synthase III